MPPTTRERLELDELLSDIYSCIETLPDKSVRTKHHFTNPSGTTLSSNKSLSSSSYQPYYAHSYVKEYELPASSPLVKEHKQALRAQRQHQQQQQQANERNDNYSVSPVKQPQRSTLKRQTNANSNTPDQQQQHQQVRYDQLQSLTSSTPENKRRVRIVDHPVKLSKNYSSSEEDLLGGNNKSGRYNSSHHKGNVEYVNTNKLIYHQEQNPDDEPLSESDENNNNYQNSDDDDDIDGVTRVEYYHTTWLDRQLGRASKRRSSKELNERQVKEKAMIEELKRSLKNGAITLRQSFKGKRNSNKSNGKPSETYDDQILDSGNNRVKQSSVFGSGLATIPRNYHNSNNKNNNNNNNSQYLNQSNSYKATESVTPNNRISDTNNIGSAQLVTPKQTINSKHISDNQSVTNTNKTAIGDYMPMQNRQQKDNQSNYHSKTLPHNYQPKKASEHQLLQSHYRGNQRNFNTINSSLLEQQKQKEQQHQNLTSANKSYLPEVNMRDPQYNTYQGPKGNPSRGAMKSPTNFNQPPPLGNTISSIPSATEVVRSALSRSSSQNSLNQLNKTINLLPNSPPPYEPTPTTPTQQLKAASPSLTPSPCPPGQHQHQRLATETNIYHGQHNQNVHQSSKTFGFSDKNNQQPALYGTRTIEKAPQQQHQQQPVYANPHASLMQHRIEQQMRQPVRNNASIREFNELDSLLRSLSPGTAHVTTHITPGYERRPAQPSFGFGNNPVQQQPQQQPSQQQQPQQQSYRPNSSDIYAKVQKQPTAIHDQSSASYLQQHYGTSQPYTVDVTDKKIDENCLQRRNQEISEFEPPDELLPTMEDYQNISRLNPVKNKYWYKPNMSRDRAINLLKDKPQGTFIVRDSTSFKGAFGLAVKVSKLPKNVLRYPNDDPSSELIRHFLIEPHANGVRLKGYANESVYASLPALIYQHSLTELALPCKLVIPRADIEDPMFNHKQKQFYDDFLASKEQAKHYPYDRTTTPDGGYRKYPGDPPVLVHNEHRMIFQ